MNSECPLYTQAYALVPLLRERATAAEQARRVQPETIAQAQEMGLLDLMVPVSYGGKGLGVRELCETARILSHGDASAAWVIAFIIQHNWMACRLPLSCQARLYQDKSAIAAASSLQSIGKATAVSGGYRVSGQWSFASGAWSSEYTFLAAKTEDCDDPMIMLVPLGDADLDDDWYMSGMCATESISFRLNDVFVPQDCAMLLSDMFSVDSHYGVEHPEHIFHISMLPGAAAMLASFPLGCAQAASELAKQRIQGAIQSKDARRTSEAARIRWAKAHQLIRAAELLWENLISTIEAKSIGENTWTDAETGQLELDRVSIAHNCKEAVRLLLDGAGARAFKLNDPMQQHLRDIEVLANHIAHDQDIVTLRGANQLIGI